MTPAELAGELESDLAEDRPPALETLRKAVAALRQADTDRARLATAEADADQLYDMLDTHWDGGACCNDWATEDDEAMQLHREAVARRKQP